MLFPHSLRLPIIRLIIILLILPVLVDGQRRTPYYDGPYIFNGQDSLHIKWVEKGYAFDTTFAKSEATIFSVDSLPEVDLRDLSFKKNSEYSFRDVNKVVAISDVHGQYDLMIQLLKTHNVIDEDEHWMLGDGHLVVIGDNFGRGDKVLEIMWFLFRLHKEAESAGGRVHMMLGNHEAMTFNGDLRFLNRKYVFTTALFTTPYPAFFKEGSILGDWISSHSTMIEINNDLFVHAGVSPDLIRLGLSIDTINQIFSEELMRINEAKVFNDSIHEALYTGNGPLWYRGYFDPSQTIETIHDTMTYVFDRMDYNKIILGHTSNDSITTWFNNRIINIDSNIKLGETGQLLIIEDGKYFVGKMDGSRKEIPEIAETSRKSLFEFIYEQEGMPHITIETDVGDMKSKSKGRKEEYQPAHVTIKDTSGQLIFELPGRLRARGNMRKQVCQFPPVKLDFSKSDLDSLGFVKVDKLKVVFPCRDKDSDQEMLYKEELLYHMYNYIDSNCVRTKLVEFTLLEDGKEKNHFTGFLVEDEIEYARRKNAIIVESGKLKAAALDREPFLKMDFFQYMIANTDWSISNKHNLEMVKLPDRPRVIALPYDFDYSGFVGQRYAVPHESLPIKSVHDRYFFSYPVNEAEFMQMVEYYASIEGDIYKIIDDATHMEEKTRENCKDYIGKFFEMLDNPDRMKKRMLRD